MDYQTYAGTASPINFNGLVRQYYLRAEPHQGDIQVNLVDKDDRDRQSHEIAMSVRAPLQEIGSRHGANVKIVEVPPGPPARPNTFEDRIRIDRRLDRAGRRHDGEDHAEPA